MNVSGKMDSFGVASRREGDFLVDALRCSTACAVTCQAFDCRPPLRRRFFTTPSPPRSRTRRPSRALHRRLSSPRAAYRHAASLHHEPFSTTTTVTTYFSPRLNSPKSVPISKGSVTDVCAVDVGRCVVRMSSGHRKTQSFDGEVRSTIEGTKDLSPNAKPTTARHRRQSSIPRPSKGAPMFRNDTLDRFYSNIPYPASKGYLPNEPAEREEHRRRERKSRGATPRGGLTNVFTRREHKEKGEKIPEWEGVSVGGNPSLSDARSQLSCRSFGDFHEYPQTPRSEGSRDSVAKDRSYSVTSQSTVLEHGSEMTDSMEDWGGQAFFVRNSFADSDMSFDMDDPNNRTDKVELQPLPPSFLKDCRKDNGRIESEWNMDWSALRSASELHGEEPWMKDDGRSKTATPTSTISSNRPDHYRFGRFRRRPQVPISESSDAADGGQLSERSATPASSEKIKKWETIKAVGSPFSKYLASVHVTPSPDPSDDSLDDISLCALKSAPSTPLSLTSRTFPADSYDWVQQHSGDCYSLEKPLSGVKRSPDDDSRPNRAKQWLKMIFGVSVKALVVASGVAFYRIATDCESTQTSTRQNKEIPAFDDDDDHRLCFSNYPLVPTIATTHVYPISLVESYSDVEDP